MKNTYALLGLLIFSIFIVMCFIVSGHNIDQEKEFAYTSEGFSTALERGQFVVISIGASWNPNWHLANREFTENQKWIQFFKETETKFFVYDCASGVSHEELFDLQNGAGETLLAVYNDRLGSRPLIAFSPRTKVETLQELHEALSSKNLNAVSDDFEFISADGTYFSRNIPLAARGP